jgi:hypothetical protein
LGLEADICDRAFSKTWHSIFVSLVLTSALKDAIVTILQEQKLNLREGN